MKLNPFRTVFTVLSLLIPVSATAGGYTALNTITERGLIDQCVAGPGPTSGTERAYLTFTYDHSTVDLVAVDPNTGAATVYNCPAAGEYGAPGMAVGDDGLLYLGTYKSAHFMRLKPATGSYTDLGIPCPGEQYIWDLTVGSDHKIYGGTYPNCHLVCFDPATGTLHDLGRMDSSQQYARWIAADDNGMVYIGTGSTQAHLIAYNISTKSFQNILPSSYQVPGWVRVRRASDNNIYAQVMQNVTTPGAQFRISGTSCTLVSSTPFLEANQKLADGRYCDSTDSGTELRLYSPTTSWVKVPFNYAGRPIDIFRLGIGPDGGVYAGTSQPCYLCRINPSTNALTHFGELDTGEAYSMLANSTRLLLGSYFLTAPLEAFDPTQSLSSTNPVCTNWSSGTRAWRPKAMVQGSDGLIYIGAVPDYGLLGGDLTVWNAGTSSATTYKSVVNQESIVSLALTQQGLIAGGTSIYGGLGTTPTQTDAELFLWNPATSTRTYETIPVPGRNQITDLVTVENGHIFGIAYGDTGANYVFDFDPVAEKVVRTYALPQGGSPLWNSAMLSPDGYIFLAMTTGVFVIDPNTCTGGLISPAPAAITAGFASSGSMLYLGIGATVYQWDPNGSGATVTPVTKASLGGTWVSGTTYDSAVSVTLTASDPPNLNTTTYYTLDGGSTTSYSAPFTVSALGTHTVKFWSVDELGDAESPNTQSLTVQTAPAPPPAPGPATLAGTMGLNGWYTSGVTVTLPTPTTGTLWYKLDSWGAAQYTGPLTLTTDGSHTIQYYVIASSAIGPLTGASSYVSFKVDRNCPTLTVTATPSSLKANSGSVNVVISGTITDPASGINLTSGSYWVIDQYSLTQPSGKYSISSSGAYSYTLSLNSALKSGYSSRLYHVWFSVTDLAGNKRTSEISVTAQ